MEKMIIFQSNPSRLYPKIISSIKKQFPNNIHIHEFLELDNDNTNNELNITAKNFKFPRCDFIHGIFPSSKIDKKIGDFSFTIEMEKEKMLKEYLAGILYFGSYKYIKNNYQDDYDNCLFHIFQDIQTDTNEEILYKLKNKQKISGKYKGIEYILRDELLETPKNVDYVGSFENLEQTAADIKDMIGLDLSNLVREKIYSYKK
jgi:hypothetical protein|tara:strand:- start:1861 stop:2469 length:609 start_codon:yes stop_codon:yes gene_type:complete